MSQLRFKIGVPQAGSSAREEEQDSGLPIQRPFLAGSAAREAETGRRLEPVTGRLPNRIALRGTGGITGVDSTNGDISACESAKSLPPGVQVDAVTSTSAATTSGCAANAALKPESGEKVEAVTRSGLSQFISTRFSSLSRSLFPGTRTVDPTIKTRPRE